MLKEGFLYLHSSEVPKMMTTTLQFASGRWRQQREALDVPVGPEAHCAKHGGVKPALEPSPPLFVAGVITWNTRKEKSLDRMAEAAAPTAKSQQQEQPCRSGDRDELVVLRTS